MFKFLRGILYLDMMDQESVKRSIREGLSAGNVLPQAKVVEMLFKIVTEKIVDDVLGLLPQDERERVEDIPLNEIYGQFHKLRHYIPNLDVVVAERVNFEVELFLGTMSSFSM
jgi:hypothetical protein